MAGGLCNAGLTEIAKWITGDGSPTNWAYANAYMGVGDNPAAYAAGQTDLQAATNKLRKAMFDSSWPSRSGLVMSWKSKFLAGEANFHWQEVIVANDASAGSILFRDVLDLGTKPNTQEWWLQYDVTLSAA